MTGLPPTRTRRTPAKTSTGRVRYCTLTAQITAEKDASAKGSSGVRLRS
jgi:hypothetical protein